ncbi:MAG: sigma-70 family RNA polymerase sigma factor [Planctomycetes bacterium]|nr:sigma-70 family RNA polymerase sigma factor [Planctomycetota bacterium]
MSPAAESDILLVSRVRQGEGDAWSQLIARFQGRLLAFVESRIGNRAAAEDVVQETFIGFLTSLPNFDEQRPLESYLFSIAAHKLTDHLRREGRRPTLPLSSNSSSQGDRDLPGAARAASSIMRSGERKGLESDALAGAVGEQIERWKKRGDWTKLKCIELLFVRGMVNKHAALQLEISEQAVANYKFDFLARLRTTIRSQGLPEDVFPNLTGE